MDTTCDAQDRIFNTLPLASLLREADAPFRQAVTRALMREGFELDETFPCLHHPTDILQAIAWLEKLDFGPSWESFHQALEVAGKLGILMDLSSRRSRHLPPRHVSTSWPTGPQRPRPELG
jgi:hypothetical protein